MDFRTEIKIVPSIRKINLDDPVMLIGSCFSENIGGKLRKNKFRVNVNPFGTVYNPHSIFYILRECLSEKPGIEENDIIFNQGIYRNLNFHSAVSHAERSGLAAMTEERFRESADFISGTKWLIITFGTAIVYRYNETGKIVGNCHKIPSDRFTRSMLSVNDIIQEFRNLCTVLLADYENLNIILTVSPVRHLREGFEDNQVSKSILRLACEKIVSTCENVHYFPAYEIMLDDLRDYRYYGQDMVHPNEQGIAYIWEKFSDSMMDDETISFMRTWNKILNAMNHRPFNTGTQEYHDFISNTIRKLEALKDRIDVEEEIRNLEQSL